MLDEELSRYRAMLLCKRYEQHREALLAMEYGRLVFPRAVSEEDKVGAKAARDGGKDLIKEQKKRFVRGGGGTGGPSPFRRGGARALQANAGV